MHTNKSLTDLIFDQFAIQDTARPQLMEWEALMIVSTKANQPLSPSEWIAEVENLWSICQNHANKRIGLTFDPLNKFSEMMEQWRKTLLGNQKSIAMSSPKTVNLKELLLTHLNLETEADRKLNPCCKIWKSRVERGVSLSEITDVVRKKCRNLAGSGYYDPDNQLTNIVELWYQSIHDENAFNTVLSVVKAVLCK